jgi:hypothetical protein
MSVDYTQQKLWEAVSALIGTGTLQRRLDFAAQHLVYLRKPEAPFPSSSALGERLEEVIGRLTNVPATGAAGTIAATTSTLDDAVAEEIAIEILSLLLEATRLAEIPTGVTETLRDRP